MKWLTNLFSGSKSSAPTHQDTATQIKSSNLTNQSPSPRATAAPPSATPAKPVPAPSPAQMESEWQQFFEIVPIHQSAQSFLKSFVGSWPIGVTPNLFAVTAYQTLIERLQSHITGPYPVAYLRSTNDPPKADYQMVNGRIARSSSPFIDMLICGVIPRNEITSQEPHKIVWHLIEKHSSSSLAKLLFTLPRVAEASKAAAGGKAAVLVIEDVQIQVYKGIENIIFGAYDDLPEGGYLNDRIVDQKLRTLLPP